MWNYNSFNLETCPLELYKNVADVSNSSSSQISQNKTSAFSSQDKKLLSILQDLQQNLSYEKNSRGKCIFKFYIDKTRGCGSFNASQK